MKWYVGCDHAGFNLKSHLAHYLRGLGDEVVDLGTNSTERVDYPDYAEEVAHRVVGDPPALGLLVCGSGTGMAIAANKLAGIRAACITDVTNAHLAREHNDANVLCLGERVTGCGVAEEIARAFRDARFEGGRHAGRVDKIRALDASSRK